MSQQPRLTDLNQVDVMMILIMIFTYKNHNLFDSINFFTFEYIDLNQDLF